jgi:hypothetical protein
VFTFLLSPLVAYAGNRRASRCGERCEPTDRPRSDRSHNAYSHEIATIHYRWHPLFGQSLRVRRRMVDWRGDNIFVELPDGTICSLPAWMFRPDCSVKYSLGDPLVAISALCDLRDLLSSLQPSEGWDKDSTNPPSTEGLSEKTKPAERAAAEPAVARGVSDSRPRKQAKELALALVELLISGYRDSIPSAAVGGENEPKADR